MGRAVNSFLTWTGKAAEIDGDRVTLPEKDLWVAVLARAALDACGGPPHLDMTKRANVSHHNTYDYNRDQARHFFLDGGPHFNIICELAGRNPRFVRQQVTKVLLRKNGWNIDVPITSHYRKGRGKKRGPKKKKHLTGNAYYAAKAGKEMKKKNLYYQGMGAKGGRPRIYNVV